MSNNLTGLERMQLILKRKKADRIGFFEHFWGDTIKKWSEQGKILPGENLTDHFGFDIEQCRPDNLTADINKIPEVVEETEETILQRDGNGALLRKHKLHDTTPEHVDFQVKDMKTWQEFIKPLITPSQERINFEFYKKTKDHSAKSGKFLAWSGTHVFQCMSNVCGHESMLAGMILEPEWIKDMVNTYTELIIGLMEITFEKCGFPDGIWFAEDLGFKEHSFMSPAMFKEFIFPAYKKTFDYAHSLGLPVVLHSCGYIEKLVPLLIEAGINCLQPMEIKSGMNLLRLYNQFGDKISFMGGLDVRVLNTNDKTKINEVLVSNIPVIKQGFGYTLHSDHSIPKTVEYDTFLFFRDRGLELGKL